MANRYTTLSRVMDKIQRDPLFSGLTYEAVIDYYIDFVQYVGSPTSFDTKMAELTIINYRTGLPSDLVDVEQVMIDGSPARSATDTLHKFYGRVATTSNQSSDQSTKFRRPEDLTFKVEGGVLYASKEVGKITLIYKAIPLLDGEPAIDDSPNFIRALRAFIELEFLRVLWRNDKITADKVSDAQQEYAWAVGAYETHSRKLDLGKAESLLNSYKTLLIRDNEFNARFRNLGTKELIRNQ